MGASLDALGWIGESLDKPGAATRGLLAGRLGELAVNSPSQVYSPFIAPAAQRVPSNSPLLAFLLGHNILARSN